MSETAQQTIGATDLPEIGEALGDGTFVTRYWLANVEYALVDLGAEQELAGEWGKYGQEVQGAASYSDGMTNTVAMSEAGCEIAQHVLKLEAAFIPSALELNLLFSAKHAGHVRLKNTWYWSSSQRSADLALVVHFLDGNQNGNIKDDNFLVRPVRRLRIQ